VSRLVTAAGLLAALCAACEKPAKETAPAQGGVDASSAKARLEMPIEKPRPGDAAAAAPLVAQARSELLLGRQDVAEKLLEQALAADPANLQALNFQGTLLLAKGLIYDPSLALLSFRTALLVEPGNVAARVGEAVAHAELEDDERAQQLVATLLADDAAGRVALLDDQRIALHRSAGRLALRAARLDDALREVDAAIVIRPGDKADRASVVLRAEILERSGRAAEAEAELSRALKSSPEDAAVHFARARVLRRLGRAAEADQEVRIHQALVPFEEVASKAFRTDWPRRIELRRALIAAWPEYRRAHHLLVRELLGAGQLPDARAELDALLAEQPNDAEALFLLARTLAKQGDKEGARAAAARMRAAAEPVRGAAAARQIYDDLMRAIEEGRDE
jgi:predicted Zn-dependent protease